ncbi:MAG: alanine--glyoxylate aminotransferase family protein [Thaumarchaeota archaeon]|nr:alanine--glyoxylate aminotransferase family protein [Nitrososphaerota archaeon]
MSDDLLLIPGPTMVADRVRQTMATPQLGHNSPRFVEAMKEALQLTKFAFQTESAHPYIITGSGNLGMETVAVSLMEHGDKTLVVDTGAFGKRFGLMLDLHCAKTDMLSFPLGRHADPKLVDEKLSRGDYKALFVTHVDTSTTVVNSLHEIVGAAKKHGVLSVVDSVCGIAGCEFDFDGLGCDIALTASQKAIAAPPGTTLIVLDGKALEAMQKRKTEIASYYMNLIKWKKVMDDPSEYLATPAIPNILALREALTMVKEEGLEKRWRRHRIIAEGLRAGLEALDLGFVAEEGCRANTVTGFYAPQAKDVQRRLREDFHVQVALGIGEIREKSLRIGHFGIIGAPEILTVLSALEKALQTIDGKQRRRGTAVEAALSHLDRLQEA